MADSLERPVDEARRTVVTMGKRPRPVVVVVVVVAVAVGVRWWVVKEVHDIVLLQ